MAIGDDVVSENPFEFKVQEGNSGDFFYTRHDLTDLVRDWQEDRVGKFGFQIRGEYGGDRFTRVLMSSETKTPPELFVEYREGSGPLANFPFLFGGNDDEEEEVVEDVPKVETEEVEEVGEGETTQPETRVVVRESEADPLGDTFTSLFTTRNLIIIGGAIFFLAILKIILGRR